HFTKGGCHETVRPLACERDFRWPGIGRPERLPDLGAGSGPDDAVTRLPAASAAVYSTFTAVPVVEGVGEPGGSGRAATSSCPATAGPLIARLHCRLAACGTAW